VRGGFLKICILEKNLSLLEKKPYDHVINTQKNDVDVILSVEAQDLLYGFIDISRRTVSSKFQLIKNWVYQVSTDLNLTGQYKYVIYYIVHEKCIWHLCKQIEQR